MGSCEVKIIYIFSYSKRDGSGHSHNQTKAKSKSNCVKFSARLLGLNDLLGSEWLGSGASPVLLSAANAACLRLSGSGQLHSTAVAVTCDHPMLLTSQNGGNLRCYWAAPSPIASSRIF